ncbi:MAG: helix-turn-helix domain-containing protein, partial [Paraclostridium sp.]
LRSGEKKRVSKGMRDKEGYWYKNETLIDRLEITREEQKNLKTIIGTDEKYDRKNEKRRAERRNEEGLTKREQEKLEKEEQIKILIGKGHNMSQVAKELGINRSTISRHYKHLFKK